MKAVCLGGQELAMWGCKERGWGESRGVGGEALQTN